MWSKTKKALMDRMAESIKPRVNYEFYMKQKSYLDRAFFIQIDKKRYFASVPGCAGLIWDFERGVAKALAIPYQNYEEWKKAEEVGKLLAMKYIEEAGIDFVMQSIHLYLNEYSFEESLSSENYFIYLLAILDRRLGKRRLKEIYKKIEKEPEWIRRFILLRAEAENICDRSEKTETVPKREKDKVSYRRFSRMKF